MTKGCRHCEDLAAALRRRGILVDMKDGPCGEHRQRLNEALNPFRAACGLPETYD